MAKAVLQHESGMCLGYYLYLHPLNVGLTVAFGQWDIKKHNAVRGLKAFVHWSLCFLAALWNREITMKKP